MSNETKNNLRRRVMLRIYVEYFKYEVGGRIIYILPVMFLIVLWFFVSIPDIWANTPKDGLGHATTYLSDAVAGTEITVQVILGVFLASTLYLGVRRAPRIVSSWVKPLARLTHRTARV